MGGGAFGPYGSRSAAFETAGVGVVQLAGKRRVLQRIMLNPSPREKKRNRSEGREREKDQALKEVRGDEDLTLQERDAWQL